MPVLDWIFAAILLTSLLLGMWRGLVFEVRERRGIEAHEHRHPARWAALGVLVAGVAVGFFGFGFHFI